MGSVDIFLTAEKAQWYKILEKKTNYMGTNILGSLKLRYGICLKAKASEAREHRHCPLDVCSHENLSTNGEIDFPRVTRWVTPCSFLKTSLSIWTLGEYRCNLRKCVSLRGFLFFTLSFFLPPSLSPFLSSFLHFLFIYLFFFWETKVRILPLEFSNFLDFISWERFCTQWPWLRLNLVSVILRFSWITTTVSKSPRRDHAFYSVCVAHLSAKQNLVSTQV